VELIMILIFALLFGWWSNYIGDKKGRDNCFWWGFLLGWIGVIITWLLPRKN